MKNFTITVFLFTLSFIQVLAQETTFQSTGCTGGAQIGSAPTCPSFLDIPITVSGQGIMGENNIGIVEVFIDVDQPSFFDADVTLVSPTGQEYLLAAAEGFSSFPGYSGTFNGEILDVGFRNCSDLPLHNTNISNPGGMTFQPVSDFSFLNDGVTSANGTWNLRFCGFGEILDIYCASVTFGPICPELSEAIVTPASCAASSDGSVELVIGNQGACPGADFVYSIDGTNYVTTNTITGIAPGDYTGYVAQDIVPSLQGGGVPSCITTLDFTITSEDVVPPFFTDCPQDITVSVDANCNAEVTIIDPIITDNCGLIPVIEAFITYPDGTMSDNLGIAGGYPFTFTTSGVGETTLFYNIEDEAGNVATCTAVITTVDQMAPVWTNESVTVNVECGVDDIDATVAAQLSNLTWTENCSTGALSLINNEITPQCGNSEWNDWFYALTDENGNVNLDNGSILINVNDNTPPSITGLLADMTISCNDDLPAIPVIGTDIFANDLCEGDVTSDLIQSITSSFGDCTANQAEEIITYTYTVTDGCFNQAQESFSISIFNNVAPEWNAPYSISEPVNITLECGVDDLDDAILANFPIANGCNGEATTTIEALQIFNNCEPSDESQSLFYTYVATDDCGNQNFTNVYFYYNDTQAPVINGVPADLTVNCDDTPPAFPTVTALDACEGEVTDLIDYNVNTTALSCAAGQNAFVETHTWNATDFCGNAQLATWTVTYINDEAVDLGADITACVGELVTLSTSGLTGTYLWSNGATTSSIDVGNEGNYSVTVTGMSGCCSIDDINVTYQNIPDASATGGTLDCSGNDIMIMGNSTSSGVSFSWSGPGGFTSNEQNPAVSQAGTYTLTVSTSANCSATADAIVEADTDVPDINTTGGVIDCDNDEVTIMGSSSTSGVTYSWTGPNNFTSDDQNPTVDVAGTYELVISAPNGCIAEGVAVVEDDTTAPAVSLVGGTIDCDNDMVTIMTTTSDADADFSWTGPNGFTSSLQNPEVSIAGEYTVIASSANGCTTPAAITISEDGDIPNLTATGGTIDCNNDEVTLMASSTTTGVSYQWSGPNGYSSNEETPNTSVAGEYTITVSADNGCDNTMMVTVTEDTQDPTLSLDGGTLTCTDTELTLVPDVDVEVTYTWSGPDGFTSSEESPTVTMAGMYSLTVLGDNGCTASTEITIDIDVEDPSITANGGIIDCNNAEIQLNASSSDQDLTYVWTGPANFESSEQNPTVDAPGSYSVTATAENGCTTTMDVTVDEDIDVPTATAMGGTIDCDANTVMITGDSDTEGVTFSWSGPNDYSSNTQNPEVGSPGTYTLTVTGENGCTATATAEVSADENLPNINATGGTLSCAIETVQLTGSSTTDDVTFQWTGPGNLNTNDPNPTVTEPGVYTLVVTSPNGCSSETAVTVDLDDNAPAVVALGGMISCDQSSTTLISNSSDDVTFSWVGPGGFTSDEANPTVTEPGEYTLTVTGENGCTNSTTVMVLADDDLPVAELADPAIDCDQAVINLSVDTDTDLTYKWTKDGEIIATGTSVQISQAGQYEVEVISDNGCSITLSYMLEQDIQEVEADITTTDATSSENGTATLGVTNDASIVSILWDNGDTDLTATDLTVGVHTVTVIDIFGCSYTFSFEIKMSTATEEISGLESYRVYPTLANSYVNVDIELSTTEDIALSIYSMNGQLIESRILKGIKNVSQTLDISELTAGLYLISIQVDNQVRVRKIMKQ